MHGQVIMCQMFANAMRALWEPSGLVFIIRERSQYLAIPEADLESNASTDVAVNLINVGQCLRRHLGACDNGKCCRIAMQQMQYLVAPTYAENN